MRANPKTSRHLPMVMGLLGLVASAIPVISFAGSSSQSVPANITCNSFGIQHQTKADEIIVVVDATYEVSMQSNVKYSSESSTQAITFFAPTNACIGDKVQIFGSKGIWALYPNFGQKIEYGEILPEAHPGPLTNVWKSLDFPGGTWTEFVVWRRRSAGSSALAAIDKLGAMYTSLSGDMEIRPPESYAQNWTAVATSRLEGALYATTTNNAVLKSSDWGAHWAALPNHTNSTGADFTAIAVSAKGEYTVAATSKPDPVLPTNGKIFVWNNNASTVHTASQDEVWTAVAIDDTS